MKVSKIVIWSVIALILTSILITLLIFRGPLWDAHWDANLSVVYDKEFSGASIENLNIKWTSGRVNIYKSENENLRVVQKASKELKEEQKVQVNDSNNTLSINENGRFIFLWFLGFGNYPTELNLYLPEKEYNDIVISSTSGNINVNNLSSKTCEIKLTSRKIHCRKFIF